ncbi:hypothetical protein CGRA01v4_00797 [Colletotrichum graminicola]|nr:hypothetical protein CGRA01v4_00797 [Colletotrichum graminicola]
MPASASSHCVCEEANDWFRFSTDNCSRHLAFVWGGVSLIQSLSAHQTQPG